MTEVAGHSRFWSSLLRDYARVPGTVLCRIPEAEYASAIQPHGEVLDHCCGDGKFARMVWEGRTISSGCDIDIEALEVARGWKIYNELNACDAGEGLPYPDSRFNVVFNNSGLEHIPNVRKAVAEIGRVLIPGGKFLFNVLNHRYFEWWPLTDRQRDDYRAWQPFHHALDLDTWSHILSAAGLSIISVKGYFDRPSARLLAKLDYLFSSVYLGKQKSHTVRLFSRCRPVAVTYCTCRLSRIKWRAGPDEGAGYSVTAERNHG